MTNKINRDVSDSALLPSGFVDLLSPEANAEARAITVLMDEFVSFGYERVKPPMAEFETSLLAEGPGSILAEDTFRIMDPISHKMMGIRSDITPQIARLASSRLIDEVRPLRLCYANDVLRTRASQQRTERQFCQVGCEIIGVSSIQADIEAIVVGTIGLKALGLKDLTVDLCAPRLVDAVLDNFDLEDDVRRTIRDAADQKDVDAIAMLDPQVGEVFTALLDTTGGAKEGLDKLLGITLPKKAAELVVQLHDVCRGVMRAFDELGYDDVAVTIDPLEFKGLDYKVGVGFTFFSRGLRGEIGRGGRYDVAADTVETAVGFTLYMDTIRLGMPKVERLKSMKVSYDMGWDELMDLKKSGHVIVREL